MSDLQRAVASLLAAVATCTVGLAFHIESAVRTIIVTGGLAGVVLAIGLLAAVRRHRRWVRRLSQRSASRCVAGTDVRMGEVRQGAVVAGLLRPRIYCDASLVRDLAPDELRAVLLHERAHQRALDPLRLTLLSLLTPMLLRSDRGRALVERLRAEREILADRYAIQHGAPRSAIAAALLKMPVPDATAATVAAFTNATELRLRALLDEEIPTLPTVTGLWLLAGVVMGALLCASSLEVDPDVLSLVQLLTG